MRTKVDGACQWSSKLPVLRQKAAVVNVVRLSLCAALLAVAATATCLGQPVATKVPFKASPQPKLETDGSSSNFARLAAEVRYAALTEAINDYATLIKFAREFRAQGRAIQLEKLCTYIYRPYAVRRTVQLIGDVQTPADTRTRDLGLELQLLAALAAAHCDSVGTGKRLLGSIGVLGVGHYVVSLDGRRQSIQTHIDDLTLEIDKIGPKAH